MNYKIENGKYGTQLSLTSDWDDEIGKYMSEHGIAVLAISYTDGFNASTVDFLRRLPFLEGLILFAYHIKDLSPIQALHELKYLQLDCSKTTAIDFSYFPLLKEYIAYRYIPAMSLSECTSLETLQLYGLPAKDVVELGSLCKLKSLKLTECLIQNLKGLSGLSALTELGLYYLRKLESLDGLEALTNIQTLDIQTCKGLETIDPIRHLKKLKNLTLANCGTIDSLGPLEGLTSLKRIEFWESTNITDGDLSPLTRLPNLKETRFQNRRHYTHKREQLKWPG